MLLLRSAHVCCGCHPPTDSDRIGARPNSPGALACLCKHRHTQCVYSVVNDGTRNVSTPLRQTLRADYDGTRNVSTPLRQTLRADYVSTPLRQNLRADYVGACGAGAC